MLNYSLDLKTEMRLFISEDVAPNSPVSIGCCPGLSFHKRFVLQKGPLNIGTSQTEMLPSLTLYEL